MNTKSFEPLEIEIYFRMNTDYEFVFINVMLTEVDIKYMVMKLR